MNCYLIKSRKIKKMICKKETIQYKKISDLPFVNSEEPINLHSLLYNSGNDCDGSEAEQYLLQRKPDNLSYTNNTGIPSSLKKQFEDKSDLSFDDVSVHYNSDKPKQLQAFAYTQGNQVYLGPGQEEFLEHELGHVVQQKQGIVHPTKIESGIAINDDDSLERMADKIMRPNVQIGDKSEKSDVIQKKGAINIYDIFELHGIDMSELSEVFEDDILCNLRKYSEVEAEKLELQEKLASDIIYLIYEKTYQIYCEKNGIVPEKIIYILGTVRRIIENEVALIQQQKKYQGLLKCLEQCLDFKTNKSTKIEPNNFDEMLKTLKYAYDEEKNDIEKQLKVKSIGEAKRKSLEFRKDSIVGIVSSLKEELSNPLFSNKVKTIEKEIGRFKQEPIKSPDEEVYDFMHTGAYWKKQSITAIECSKLNIQSIEAELHMKNQHINELSVKIQNALIEQVKLTHYSSKGDISMLMSQRYGASSGIALASNNSDLGKERELGNTGFVFFALETITGKPRGCRYGNFQYSVKLKLMFNHRILNKSWIMLSDMVDGWKSFKSEGNLCKTVGTPTAYDADEIKKRMQFDSEGILGKMKFSDGSELEYKAENNILHGEDILPGIAKRAGQLGCRMYGDEKFYEIISGMNYESIAKFILSFFRIQVMVPHAIVPEEIKNIIK